MIQIGQIVFSTLSLNEFQAKNGAGWVPCDGTQLPADSAYSKIVTYTILPSIPNAFIRIN